MKNFYSSIAPRNLLFFFCCFLPFWSGSQVKVFATTVTDNAHVTSISNAINGNLTDSARIESSSGIAAGIGAYNGYLELEFPSVLPANTTSYLKMTTEDNLLSGLVGGSLGGLLSDIAGVVLVGNQEFTVEAKNGSTTVLARNSQIPYDFATEAMRVVIDSAGNSYIAITPSAAYNRIRVTNGWGSLLGLFNTRDISVYGAFYFTGSDPCGSPTFTSFDGTGISLSALSIGEAGVNNPKHVIDNDLNTFSELALGTLGVLATIDQTVYFEGFSNANDGFNIRLRIDPSLIAIGLLDNVNITAYNGINAVQTTSLGSLLNVSLLGLLNSNQIVTIPFYPGVPANRIKVGYGAVVGASLVQKIDFFDIVSVPALPVLAVGSDSTAVCKGSSASLQALATPNTLEIRWYDTIVGGTPVFTALSGTTFVTPAVFNSTSYYVASALPGCAKESARLEAKITMLNTPLPGQLSVTGNTSPTCVLDSVVLIPSGALPGTFNWYFDAQRTVPIVSGQVYSGAVYTINPDGLLSIQSLVSLNPSDTVYLSLVDSLTGCENIAGELLTVGINIKDTTAPTTTLPMQSFCALDMAAISDLQIDQANVVWYDQAIGGNVLPVGTLLTDNSNYYASQLTSDGCQSSTRLQITASVGDTSAPTATLSVQPFCFIDGPTVADLQTDQLNIVWYDQMTGGNMVPFNTSLSNNVYYASQLTSLGCESSMRLEVTATVGDTTAPTTSAPNQAFCFIDGPTVANLQTDQLNIVWYDQMTGGNIVPLATALSNNAVYYASQLTVAGCESYMRLQVNAIVGDTTAPTTTSPSQTFCLTNAPTVANLQTDQSNIVWYDQMTGGNVIPSSNALSNSTVYYASQLTASGCESSARLQVTAIVNDTTAPTTSSINQVFCLVDAPTVANLQTDQSNIVWYDQLTGGNVVPTSTALLNNTLYYASQLTASGCESSLRLPITAIVGDTTAPTTSSANQTFCLVDAPTVANLQTDQSNIVWYDQMTGGSIVPLSTVLSNNDVYYASQLSMLGCESTTRLQVVVSVDDTTAPTATSTNQTFCLSDGPTVANLQTNQSNIVWYDQMTGGNVVPSNTTLSNNSTFYASQLTASGCESSIRLQINVSLNDTTAPTAAVTTQVFCLSDSSTLADIHTDQSNVVWYTQPTGGNPLPLSTLLVNNGNYYAAQTTSFGCESSGRLLVTVQLSTPNVASLLSSNNSPCVNDTVQYFMSATMSNYNWMITNGIIVSGGSSTDSSITLIWTDTSGTQIQYSYADPSSCSGMASGVFSPVVYDCSDLIITKTVDNLNPFPGENVNFTITVLNAGNSAHSLIIVEEALPDGYTYVTSTATLGSYAIATGEWMIPTLNAGDSAVLVLTATVNASGNYLNTATIVSAQPMDNMVGNNSAQAEVSVNCMAIYNEFSPNGDNVNDYFLIECIEAYPSCRLEIFNRFGNLVYQKDGYDNSWSGVSNVNASNEKLPAGTYYYVLIIDDMEYSTMGWIYMTN